MITVFGSIGMDLLFGLPHLPNVGETVLTPAYTTAMGGKGANRPWQPPSDVVRVRLVGSVGADGFVGVLAAAMNRGLEMQPAMRRACVAARMAVRWSVPHRACRPEWQSI